MSDGLSKSERRRAKRARAALRVALSALTLEASGPNAPSGARCSLPLAGTPQFTDSDVKATWVEEVFLDPREHKKHLCRVGLAPHKRTHHAPDLHAMPLAQAVSTTRDLRREYHFAPSPFSAQALTR